MPVEFLTDEQVSSYGRFTGDPSLSELERFFFLDDLDKAVVETRRGDANRLGFGLQLGTVRYLSKFLPDPGEVPTPALDYVARQLGVADPSCLKAYARREKTRLEHQWEIARVYGYRDFASAEAELAKWVEDRAWTTGEGPRTIFNGSVAWLRERRVLLPGVTVLTRLVAATRDATTQRLWDVLSAKVTPAQARLLDRLLEVPEGARLSDLERLRKGPTSVSGKGMTAALARTAEVAALGLGAVPIGDVPQRRLVELARWGMAGKAPALRRHPHKRRLATLLATAVYLEAKAVDDALELFDVLMANELLGRAVRESNKANLRRYPRVSRDAATCAAAVGVLLDTADSGAELTLDAVWETIEAVVSRAELRAAVANLTATLPPPDADPAGEWRAELIEPYPVVRSFVPQLCRTIEFGATAEAARVLEALRELPELLDTRATKRVPAGYLDADRIAADVVPPGWWRQLVFPPDRPRGTVHRAAYVFCVLEQFHQRLRRRDVFASASGRWADPRAKLLSGPAWEAAREPVLNALQLPAEPDALLDEDAAALDETWRQVAAAVDADVSLDAEGRLHSAAIDAIPDPPSLTDLRRRCEAMLPRVDVGELILEVMSWQPGFVQAFTAASGGETRLADLHVSIAAALTAHALNVGYTPVISPGVAALTRARISHVDQNYLRSENYAAANGPLIEAQAEIGLAHDWGGGLVAAVDGIRFVVPVRSVDARAQSEVLRAAPRGDVAQPAQRPGRGAGGHGAVGHPEGLPARRRPPLPPGGRSSPRGDRGRHRVLQRHRLRAAAAAGLRLPPQLADLPDAKLWVIDVTASYGALAAAARGRIDVGRVRQHWGDICRLVASIHTGAVSAHDVIRMLAPGGKTTQLGDVLAHYGRIFKTMHVLAYVDDEAYRRQIKGMRNLQEGRHSLGRHVFHGRKGELYQHYREGMEDQLGALGLVLNCITLWNTVYLDASLARLRADGYPVRESDVARLSPYVSRHLNVHGHYSFQLPELSGCRTLRDPDGPEDGAD